MTEIPRTVISVFGYGISVDVIVAFILGLLPFVGSYLKRRGEYPMKMFKTQYDTDINYDKERFGKLLILKVGQTYNGFLFVNSKKLCEIDIFGIRPQVLRPWAKRVFRSYNAITQNIDKCERDKSPLLITYIQPRDYAQNCHTEDDGACGKAGKFNPPILLKPGRKLRIALIIDAKSEWKGFIDFRIDTPEGRRVSHHPVQIIANKE